jgi:hypothetical protein
MSESSPINGLLHASPEAFADETPASWIQYVCAGHQYSMTRFRAIVGLSKSFKDPDVEFTEPQWQRLLTSTSSSTDACSLARREYVQAKYLTESVVLMQSATGMPRYKWCAGCFQDDERPYLRWWWRLVGIAGCVDHRQNLLDECEACGGELILSHALLVNAGAKPAVPNLSYCQHCGMPLSAPHFQRTPESDHKFEESPPDESASQMVKIWGVNQFLIDKPMGYGVASVPGRSRLSLNITGRLFAQSEKENINSMKSRAKWSMQVPRSKTKARHKVAYALALVRKELLAEKRSPPEKPDDL